MNVSYRNYLLFFAFCDPSILLFPTASLAREPRLDSSLLVASTTTARAKTASKRKSAGSEIVAAAVEKYKGYDYEGAFAAFSEVAASDNRIAEFFLASMYADGLGTARDLAKAKQLYDASKTSAEVKALPDFDVLKASLDERLAKAEEIGKIYSRIVLEDISSTANERFSIEAIESRGVRETGGYHLADALLSKEASHHLLKAGEKEDGKLSKAGEIYSRIVLEEASKAAESGKYDSSLIEEIQNRGSKETGGYMIWNVRLSEEASRQIGELRARISESNRLRELAAREANVAALRAELDMVGFYKVDCTADTNSGYSVTVAPDGSSYVLTGHVEQTRSPSTWSDFHGRGGYVATSPGRFTSTFNFGGTQKTLEYQRCSRDADDSSSPQAARTEIAQAEPQTGDFWGALTQGALEGVRRAQAEQSAATQSSANSNTQWNKPELFASNCLKRDVENGHHVLSNKCPYKLQVTWCTLDPESVCRCKANPPKNSECSDGVGSAGGGHSSTTLLGKPQFGAYWHACKGGNGEVMAIFKNGEKTCH